MGSEFMKRDDEIIILQSLKGDTYFNQFFKDEDIDRMCQNIRNDFGIECGCKFQEDVEILKKQMKETVKKFEAEINRREIAFTAWKECFAGRIIEAAGENIDAKVYDRIEEEFGIAFIIKTKRNLGITLTNSEIDYMISKL